MLLICNQMQTEIPIKEIPRNIYGLELNFINVTHLLSDENRIISDRVIDSVEISIRENLGSPCMEL